MAHALLADEDRLSCTALHPETLMMTYAYHPEWSEGAAKPPIFPTSTYVFKSAEEGKAFFSLAYGLREPKPGEKQGLICRSCVVLGDQVYRGTQRPDRRRLPGFRATEVLGGEAEAFRFLNALQVVKLAVSLGGTESLAEHPATMTHANVSSDERQRTGISPQLIRLSVGVEHPDDLIRDLAQALDAV